MKHLIKYIALIAGVFCLVLACHEYKPGAELRKQERDTLSSYDQILGSGGDVMPQALRVVPGNSWRFWRLSDSTFAIMSQDTSNNLESIIREDSLFAWLMTKLPDAVQVDSAASMLTGTYPTGTRIISRATGATYKIQGSAVSGYTTDSLLVVPTSDAYAVLESYEGKIYFSHVNQAGNDDTEVIRKMMQYAYVQANNDITTVVIDEDCYITDTVMIPATVSMIGTYQGIRTRTNDGRYSTLYLDLDDANKTAFTTEDHVYATADQYFPGGTISNLNIEALSDGHTVFNLIRPGWMQIHTLRIGSGPTQPTNFSTRYYDYAFRFDDAIKTKFSDMEIRNCKKWAFWSRDGGGTTYLDNVRLDGCENGIKADTSNLLINNCIIENIDSVGLRVYGGDVVMTYTHFETVPSTAIDVDAIQLGGGAGSLTMRSVRMNSPFLSPHAGLVCIATDDFDYLFVEDCEFHNYPTQISTTASQGQIFWQNEWKTGITNAISEFVGITDTTKLYFRNGTKLSMPGDIYMQGVTAGKALTIDADNKIVGMNYSTFADSLDDYISNLLGGSSLQSTTIMQLNNNGLWIDDAAGGHITIGNQFDYARGVLAIDGVGYSTQGWAVANNSWNKSYNTSNAAVNIWRYNSSNNLEFGSDQLNNISLQSGGTTTKYITLNAGVSGTVARLRVHGEGSVRIGAGSSIDTDNGAEMLQVTGDVYIDDVLRLKATTEPGSPLFGMIYLSSVDSSLRMHNGTTWVQLDN